MRKTPSALLALLLVGGCASVPTGPSLMALPGTGKSFEQFRSDDSACRRYAFEQIGGLTAERAATDSTMRSAVVGTVVGAAAGAAIGGHNAAGVGAGAGLVVGSAAGSDAAQRSAYGSQRSYDNAYIQCMYAKGQKVPVSGALLESMRPAQPAAAGSYPPPPPGNPPPPPPGR
ncbi:MAG: YMGG-like glycine zipper-containing protein [Betaproteobacteria bacterium]